MLLQVPLHLTPEEFDKVQFTMELGQENANVTSSIDHFLDIGMLFFKFRLMAKNLTSTTTRSLQVALPALHEQSFNPQATFSKHSFHTLWLIWKFGVVRWKDH